MAESMIPVVSVRNLQFQYEDGTAALNGVDFDLYPGETVALLGPNGSGKTTFALHLNGLLRGSGQITVCGLPLDDAHLPEIRARVGLVFQDSDEQLFMPTVLEDVAFGPRNHGMSAMQSLERAQQCLRSVGMADFLEKAPYHLSAGQKKRVAIAGILATAPEVIVLDEPTTYLDPPGQGDLLRLLRQLPQAKILVTHDVPFAAALANRADFFEKGRIIASGNVNDIARRFAWNCISE